VLFDEARDEAGRFRFLDKVAQEGSAGGVAAQRSDGLLHGGELTIEDARAGQFCEVAQQAGAQAGERIELVVGELFGGAGETVGADQRGVLDVAFQPKVIGAARADTAMRMPALSTSSIFCNGEPAGTR
jgi:hypothetical protein